jgi:hypothetical protein
MTAAIAKTQHRHQWMVIHKIACQILQFDPDADIDRFITLATFISIFTDKTGHPPRRKDLLDALTH